MTVVGFVVSIKWSIAHKINIERSIQLTHFTIKLLDEE